MTRLILSCVIIGILLSIANGQNFQRQSYRATTLSPAQVQRNKWLQQWRSRNTTPVPPRRTGNQEGPNVAGVHCDKPHAMFSSSTDLRMYHLCMKYRGNWYVYNFFCPPNAIFDDTTRRCTHTRRVPQTSSPFRRNTSRPQHSANVRVTTAATTPSTSVTTTSTTTTEHPPVPEPETEIGSSEETTETEAPVKNVVVSGLPSANPQASDDLDSATTESDDDVSEESNGIAENVVDTNTLSVHQHVPPKEKTKLKSKAMKALFGVLGDSLAAEGNALSKFKLNKWFPILDAK